MSDINTSTAARASDAASPTDFPPDVDLGHVTSNFRQYLMGWGEAERGEGDADYYRSGLAQPQFNGVVRMRDLNRVGYALDEARKRLTGVPWWWWVGPDSPQGTSTALVDHGAVEFGALPLMVRSLDRAAKQDEPPIGLRIERVADPGRLADLVRTYSASIGISSDLQDDLVRIEAQRPDNADMVRLVAVLDGQAIGTTVVITAHGVAGIFLVHVTDTHRRLGVGSALTAAALRVGRERGMKCAALTASPAGELLYRRLGFVAVSEYRLFTLPA
ncbi:GNAT family N-acetyltransferase [Streptomyces sp. GESEQ-4]|uniref:GNAT family N-acetyltransferase n=1 Tax=Streptomyces sp. GESEQ-4 TaxID=2812655 RepID=UPI0027DB93D7|nr:GNAT family N-acetyltransferase [Streptomyces sp. GESEQ-4]